MQAAYYDTVLGSLMLAYTEQGILRLCWTDAPEHSAPSTLTDMAAAQVGEYLAGKRQRFTFPVLLQGTAFQRDCRILAQQIPYGETRSYGQLAAMLGKPGAARAVGRAMAENPLLLVVPCHRVTGANGALTGYACGLWRKRALLELERNALASRI